MLRKPARDAFLTLALGVVVAGGPAAAADVRLSIGSCPVGCTAYTWSAGIADVINRHVEGVDVTAEETKGFIANIHLMGAGDLEIAMANALSAHQAFNATGPYANLEAGKVLSWMNIAPVAMHVITLADGPVKSLADLAGKRVGMGQPGGTSMLDADALMAALGLEPDTDFEPFRIRLGNMVDGLADGNLDAALWNGAFPLPPLTRLAATHEIALLPVPDDVYETLHATIEPYFRLPIPAGTYSGVEGDTPTFGLAQGMVVSRDVPEETVYQMTKAIFENLEALKTVHPAFAKISKDNVIEGFATPLHPGAIRYYREIGVPGIEDFVARTGGQ